MKQAGSSGCRSLSSTHHDYSRFQKISIGISVDKCPTVVSEATNGKRIAMPEFKGRFSSQESTAKANKGSCFFETSKPDGILTNSHSKASKNLCTKMFYETPTMLEGKLFPEHIEEVDIEKVMLKNVAFVVPKGVETNEAEKSSACFFKKSLFTEIPTSQDITSFSNQASAFESKNAVHKKIASGKRLQMGAKTERKEGFTSIQEMQMLHDKMGCEQPKEVDKFNNETLRMNLWEILGENSQRKQNTNFSNPEDRKEPGNDQFAMPSMTEQIMKTPKSVEEETLNRNQRGDLLEEKIVAKQNSDTIDTDSESPNGVIKEPITCHLKGKKAPFIIPQKLREGTKRRKMLPSSSNTASKLKMGENNIFTFDEEGVKAVCLNRHINGCNRKRSKKKRKTSEHQKVQIPKKMVLAKNLEFTEKTMLPSDKVAPKRKTTGPSPLPFHNESYNSQTSNKHANENHHLHSEATNTLVTPPVRNNVESQGHSDLHKCNRYSGDHDKNQVTVHLQERNECPSMEEFPMPFSNFQSPTLKMGTSPSKSKQFSEDICTPMASQGTIASRTFSRSNSDKLNSTPSFWDKSREINNSENLLFPHHAEKRKSPRQTFLTSTSKHDARTLEASDFSKKETDELTGAYNVPNQYPEGSLASVMCHLAFVLKEFKFKLRSQTSKKRSEILSATGEKIHSQLERAQSLIEEDLGKFLNIGKSKMKSMESKFDEQNERLKFIHNTFKEEVGQHLLGCKNTLEEIKAYKAELKVGLDRQKAAHRKFLLQVQEEIESQLHGAETKLAAIHQEANKHMNGLSLIVKEWMSEVSVN
ncbi:meiosis-specific protein PAIR3-like isoform X1 [Zingiber officinale]|uniref:meiosis-specific protein PAIR3-like isoform X1 n=2 Tax=Zingiber officinale TaxID=94328 RepID=UPI001C4B1729|nr:meiosis-specific protein PAIR3-like isoform X1 [Zingiber officinale]